MSPRREPTPVGSCYHGGFIQVAVTSFGYRHGPAPAAELTVDVREVLRDPHTDPTLRELTGLNPAVRRHVLDTPGAGPLVAAVLPPITILLATANAARQTYTVHVAIGGAGGRHRSVVLANELTGLLITAGIGAEVEHRDVHRPALPPNGHPNGRAQGGGR